MPFQTMKETRSQGVQIDSELSFDVQVTKVLQFTPPLYQSSDRSESTISKQTVKEGKIELPAKP